MDDLKKIIAENMTELRKNAGFTQLELAEKLNYSDKAISKWESGASVPDITVLYEVAKIYGVTVDYLLSREHKLPVREMVKGTVIGRRHLFITMMSVALVLLLATVSFVILTLLGVSGPLWLSFVWAVPVSAVVVLVLNSVWGERSHNYIIISVLLWSLLAAVYLTLLPNNPWLIFVLGIPGQIIVILWAGMKRKG